MPTVAESTTDAPPSGTVLPSTQGRVPELGGELGGEFGGELDRESATRESPGVSKAKIPVAAHRARNGAPEKTSEKASEKASENTNGQIRERSLEPGADDLLRSSIYALLGALLASPPDAAMLERLCAIGGGDDAGRDAARSSGNTLESGWEALRRAAEEAEIEACRDEHFDLFIGLGRGQVVPYGSWYMTGFMMDKPLAALRGDLARLGFERQENVKESEDHAGALLETMGWLAAEGEHVTTQTQFFERHMAPWMKTFFKDLQQAKAARFYRAVGLFGEQFITFEQKYLQMPV